LAPLRLIPSVATTPLKKRPACPQWGQAATIHIPGVQNTDGGWFRIIATMPIALGGGILYTIHASVFLLGLLWSDPPGPGFVCGPSGGIAGLGCCTDLADQPPA